MTDTPHVNWRLELETKYEGRSESLLPDDEGADILDTLSRPKLFIVLLHHRPDSHIFEVLLNSLQTIFWEEFLIVTRHAQNSCNVYSFVGKKWMGGVFSFLGGKELVGSRRMPRSEVWRIFTPISTALLICSALPRSRVSGRTFTSGETFNSADAECYTAFTTFKNSDHITMSIGW